jgi:hypothetical protein
MQNTLNDSSALADISTTREFRARYRKDQPPQWYMGWAHFWFTTLVSVGGILFCFTRTSGVTVLEWLTVPLTLIYANLAEYFGHKGPMHRRWPFLSTVFLHTTIHHRFFTDEENGYEGPRDFHALLLPPSTLAFFFGLFALPVGLLLYVIVSQNVACLFVASALIYFISYEWLHFSYHAPNGSLVSRLPLISRLRRHHLVHHNPRLMTRYNFNITVPLFDALFGTTFRAEGPSSRVSKSATELVRGHSKASPR